jgi:hypothetical protein
VNDNHLVVVTNLEEPKLYLAQGVSFATLATVLRTDPYFFEKTANIYGFAPAEPELQPELRSLPQLVRLAKAGTNRQAHIATQYFQAALHYAVESGSLDHLLGQMSEMLEKMKGGSTPTAPLELEIENQKRIIEDEDQSYENE